MNRLLRLQIVLLFVAAPLVAQDELQRREEGLFRILDQLATRERSASFSHAGFMPEPAGPPGGAMGYHALPRDGCGLDIREAPARDELAFIALELARIWGRMLEYRISAEITEVAGVEGVFQGFDRQRKLGLIIRGPAEVLPMRQAPKVQPPSNRFSDGEIRRLRDNGYRLFVCDLERSMTSLNDRFTTYFAYIMGWVAFLDAQDPAADLDLSSLTETGEPAHIGLAECLRGTTGHPESGSLRVDLVEAQTLSFEVPGLRLGGPDGRPASSRGERSALALSCYKIAPEVWLPWGMAPHRFPIRLRQDATEVDVRGEAQLLFPPRAFDAGAPFVIEIELDAGSYQFSHLLSARGLRAR